jgi:NAD dependent epimerase/dehydratase family enzyme
MKLHDKTWFKINASAMTSYNDEELDLIWETLSTAQLDFIAEICGNAYKAGYEDGQER